MLAILEELCDDSLLVSFVKSPPSIRYKATSASRVQPKSLLLLFMANMVITGSSLLAQYDEIADAIDFLSVSGLVHFPPTEGGPISFLKRNGCGSIITSLRQIQCLNRILKEHANMSADKLEKSAIKGRGLSLLTDDELAKIGPSYGARDLPSIVYPFPFNKRFIYAITSGFLIVVFSVIVLYLKL